VIGSTVKEDGGDLDETGRDLVTMEKKKKRGRKSGWNHNFNILEVKYGILLEVFFVPVLIGELEKHHVLGNKIWGDTVSQ
jgi:hypothetical protein